MKKIGYGLVITTLFFLGLIIQHISASHQNKSDGPDRLINTQNETLVHSPIARENEI